MRMLRTVYFLLHAAAFLLAVANAGAGELPLMTTGYSRDIFHGASQSDALAATKVWVDRLGAGVCRSGDVFVYEFRRDWAAAAEREEFTMAIISVTDYLALESEGDLEPRAVFEYDAGIGVELVLLVSKDSGIDSVAGLKDQSISISVDYHRDVPACWLDSLLEAQQLPRVDEYVKDLKWERKASAAVLPVFFGRRSACIVSRSSYETIKELNPQVGARLKVLATSPSYILTLVCFRRGSDPSFVNQLAGAMLHLHEQPRGEQVLISFKVKSIAPFRAEYLDAVRELLKDSRTKGYRRPGGPPGTLPEPGEGAQ